MSPRPYDYEAVADFEDLGWIWSGDGLPVADDGDDGHAGPVPDLQIDDRVSDGGGVCEEGHPVDDELTDAVFDLLHNCGLKIGATEDGADATRLVVGQLHGAKRRVAVTLEDVEIPPPGVVEDQDDALALGGHHLVAAADPRQVFLIDAHFMSLLRNGA
jgi:hypothetical protein